MADVGKAAMNWATVREQCDLADCIALCRRFGYAGIAPWREPVQAVGPARAAAMIADAGLAVTGLCRAGLFPAADAATRRRRIDDNRRAIDEAAAIGARCLVMVGGGLPPGSRDIAGARAMVRDGMGAVLDHARAAGVPLAVEPLHPMYAADRCVVTSLAEANDLCDQLGEGTGIAVDIYHVWWDPNVFAEIARAGAAGRLLALHVCDWLVPTTDLLLDRGMMGDGVADIPAIRRAMEANGYDGLYEIEIFSRDNWYKRPPEEVFTIGRERVASAV